MPQHVLRFGIFQLDISKKVLRKHGLGVRLSGHAMEILLLLLERHGETVSRHEIRARLWPAGTFVDFEHGLNTAMKKLRAVLADSAKSPRFIETVPRSGYRFIMPVESFAPVVVSTSGVDERRLATVAAETAITAPALTVAAAPKPSATRPMAVAAAVVILLLGAGALGLLYQPKPSFRGR